MPEAFPIGPSMGLFNRVDTSLETQERFLKKCGATAVELVYKENYPTSTKKGMLEGQLQGFDFVSLHHPQLDDPQNLNMLDTLKKIFDKHTIKGAPLHPIRKNTLPVMYRMLREHGIPFGIENMDREETSGHDPFELQTIMERENAPFVLDLQHADERSPVGDKTMLTRQYIAEVLPFVKVSHLHVSGESTLHGKRIRHALVHIAKNRDSIADALRRIIDSLGKVPPIILEGRYLDLAEIRSKSVEEIMEAAAAHLREEIDYVRALTTDLIIHEVAA